MSENKFKVYVRFIDGSNVKIPIESELISEKVYKLLPNNEFDYEDKNILFEFGTNDIVEVRKSKLESGETILTATHLIEKGNKENIFKNLLFSILIIS